MTNEQIGYKYAEQENGCLAGMALEPNDQGLSNDDDFIKGYNAFHAELDRQP